MENNKTELKSLSKNHPLYNVSSAWYVFGVFAENGMIRRFLSVEAKNKNAIQFIESMVQNDGSVSNTCGLISTHTEKPIIRSTVVELIKFEDFVIDMVDKDRWMCSTNLVEKFNESLSTYERLSVETRVDQIKRIYNMEQNNKPKEIVNFKPPKVNLEEVLKESETHQNKKLEQIQSGLIGLGFDKKNVKKYISSIANSEKPTEILLMSGIEFLNKGG
jgi:hypothetical protein